MLASYWNIQKSHSCLPYIEALKFPNEKESYKLKIVTNKPGLYLSTSSLRFKKTYSALQTSSHTEKCKLRRLPW